MRRAIVICLMMCCSLAACSDEPSCELEGVWELTFDWGAGDCGVTGQDVLTLSILDRGEGENPRFEIVGDPGSEYEGTGSFLDGRCRLQIVETFLDEDGNGYAVSMDMDLDGDVVTGVGELAVAFVEGGTCGQDFDISGDVH